MVIQDKRKKKILHNKSIVLRRVEEEGSEVDEDGMTTNSATVGDSRLRCDSLNSIPEISLPEYIKNSGDATSTQDSECRSGGYMSR